MSLPLRLSIGLVPREGDERNRSSLLSASEMSEMGSKAVYGGHYKQEIYCITYNVRCSLDVCLLKDLKDVLVLPSS